MTVAYFFHVDGPVGQHEELQIWANEVFGPALNRSDLADFIEAYTPQCVDDPYLGSEVGKLLIVRANFKTKDKLESVMADPQIADALGAMPKNKGFKTTAEAFIVREFPLLDGAYRSRSAALSFFVRYYPPIEKEQSFIDYYVNNHPPIMTRFPRIRNILCYLPTEWRDDSLVAASNSFLGNEVVFDNLDDLNNALASGVRHELRADYQKFPPHEGESTHHAMYRRVLFCALKEVIYDT